MELNITRFFNEACPKDYSASVAEIGANAGADTWRAACEDSEDYMILDDQDKRAAFRAYVKTFGAWEDTEVSAWTYRELNALLLQMVSGDIREFLDIADGKWETWQELCEAGTCSSRLFGGALSVDGQVYYSLD